MSKIQHTAGPWSYRRVYNPKVKSWAHRICGPYIGGAADIIGQTYPQSCKDEATREANAKLIAAAPDLLAALRDLVQAVEDPERDSLRQLLAAHAAIAKATGEKS